MGYLYLNFLDNLEKGSKSWDDFYTTSLTEQYEVLKRKLGGYASSTLQEFIAMAFPANTSIDPPAPTITQAGNSSRCS